MVDELIVESLKLSIGKQIVFWNLIGYRFEGRILAVSNSILKYFDVHKNQERLFSLSDIKECELK